MATRRVTQETFDAAVRENMEEFEMEAEAALREAVEQFESQGVNLNFIVKAVPTVPSDEKQDEPTHEVLQALESLRIGKDTGDFQDVMADINLFTENCQSGFAQRYLAAQKDAYPIILSFCKKSLAKPEAALASLSALAALTDGQPDLLDSEGQQFLLEALRKFQTDPTATCEAVRAVRLCCVKHEQNRQDLIKGGVLPLLTGAMTVHRECAELVKETSAALRVMTFDDDVRVTFGHAHEHAKMIVLEQNGLKVLIETAQAHLNNTSVLSDICATLSCLAVRNEFCQDISDLGGLKLMLTLLAESYETPELVKQVLGAIKAVAGNDDVKDAVVSAGGVQLIVMAMNRHLSNASVCEQGCACLAVLALRKPNNCKAIMENGGALAAIQSMKAHVDAASVQKQACMLLRNLVSRLKNYSRPILELGAEALIAHALQTHRDCGDVGKAALRDLGCKVELQELWTGKHGSLTN